MLIRIVLYGCVLLIASGCTTIGNNHLQVPSTLGEQSVGYGYVPLDGLAVDQTLGADSCKPWARKQPAAVTAGDLKGEDTGKSPFLPLLQSLPDITVRFAVASNEASNGLTFGPAMVTVKNKVYRAIVDYVNVDVIPARFLVGVSTTKGKMKLSKARGLQEKILAFDVKILPPSKQDDNTVTAMQADVDLVAVPVYIGIGMRLTADIRALEGGVPLMSLGGIGLEAQAKRIVGTLTVQTIGVTGESVAVALPLPSKLDQTTIENSILSLGANRSSIYKAPPSELNYPGTTTTPRLVGLYSPIGTEPELINAMYSELSLQRPQWPRPCIERKQPA